MNFRKLTIEDKKFCNELINKVGISDSAYSFTNWFIWSPYEKVTYSIQDNYVVSKTIDDEYTILCNKIQLDSVLSDLVKEEKSKGKNSLFIYAITEQFIDFYKKRFGNNVDIKEDLGYSDYIYTVEKLKSLRGRKLSNKRNLINRFNDLGEWKVKILNSPVTAGCNLVDTRGREISHDDSSEVNNFLKKYFYIQKEKGLEAEEDAVNNMFKYYKELNTIGVVVYLEDKPVAFSAGTQLSDKMIDTHFELALQEYKGDFQLVNREFANCISLLFPSVKYINREEDMGIDGLRQAKRSYCPDVFATKYTAKIKI